MAQTIPNGRGNRMHIFLDLILGQRVRCHVMFKYDVKNRPKKSRKGISFGFFPTKILPSIDGTNCQKLLERHFRKRAWKFFYGIFYVRRGILSITVWPFTGNFRTNSRFVISDFFCKFRAIPREATWPRSWKTLFSHTPCLKRENLLGLSMAYDA